MITSRNACAASCTVLVQILVLLYCTATANSLLLSNREYGTLSQFVVTVQS